jgi:hypothetical protein
MPSTGRWNSSVVDRRTIDVPSPAGGWGAPWPNVAEIEAVLPHHKWTLVGGLMTQLHGIHRGIDALRPTNGVDIVLHVETTRGVAAETAGALQSLGYVLAPSIDQRNNTAHRFKRGESTIDLVTSGRDVVDVLVADHAAPRVVEKLRGRTMVAIEGASRHSGEPSTLDSTSRPSTRPPSGSRLRSAPSFSRLRPTRRTRDRERHLQDAALLLAVIEDPYAEHEQLTGSDRARLRTLSRHLPDSAREWRLLPAEWRANGQTALCILSA